MFDQISSKGEILKWPTRADCKSADYVFRGSNPRLTTMLYAGVAQLARASAFQAEGRGFEPRFPLQNFGNETGSCKMIKVSINFYTFAVALFLISF